MTDTNELRRTADALQNRGWVQATFAAQDQLRQAASDQLRATNAELVAACEGLMEAQGRNSWHTTREKWEAARTRAMTCIAKYESLRGAINEAKEVLT